MLAALVSLSIATGAPAAAAEIFGGVLAQGVNTPLSDDVGQHGVALEAGWRGDRIGGLRFIGRPQPYVFASLGLSGLDFAAAGLSWKFGDAFYIRPGIGLAVHDGPSYSDNGVFRTDPGSRVLFEPELSVGIRLAPNLTAEASWVHVSHAQLFSRQNPGLDTIGVRLAWRLP